MAKQKNDDKTDTTKKVERTVQALLYKDRPRIPWTTWAPIIITVIILFVSAITAYVRRGIIVEQMIERIDKLEDTHQTIRNDPFTGSDFKSWIHLFRAMNPDGQRDTRIPEWKNE